MVIASFVCGVRKQRYHEQPEQLLKTKNPLFRMGFLINITFKLDFETFSVVLCQIDFSQTNRFWCHLNIFVFLNVF